MSKRSFIGSVVATSIMIGLVSFGWNHHPIDRPWYMVVIMVLPVFWLTVYLSAKERRF